MHTRRLQAIWHDSRMKHAILFLLLLRRVAIAVPASVGLSDPDIQPKFVAVLPNPLDPSFLYDTTSGYIEISVSEGVAETGLVGKDGVTPLVTPIWGYGTDELGHTWPGRTFALEEGVPLSVRWLNKIPIEKGYLLTGKDNGPRLNFEGKSVVDKSYHWCYSMKGYTDYSIELDGTPIVPHLHGGHSDAPYDGNPEFFFSPDFKIKGPRWVQEVYVYDNSQPAACLWYHDHALGITRLNVYSGMSGFYFLRNSIDTGKPDNPKKLPAYPYELPLLIQDRMFKENGHLFYPAFSGDPSWDDFITGEGASVDEDFPSAMAEFFGDHMLVNGKIWPKAEVEPRNYRLRLLNGCDSRFLVVQFMAVRAGRTTFKRAQRLDFYVIGGDHGFADTITKTNVLLLEPASRYDVIINFADHVGRRVIMRNIGGDEPFSGDVPWLQTFEHTNKIMAFDVTLPLDPNVADDFAPDTGDSPTIDKTKPDRVRRLALFEGKDQHGRLQPLLGTVDPATDMDGNPIYWPNMDMYVNAGLQGQMRGTMTWHAPTTENIKLNDVEEWEIWNFTEDAHPLHLHLVNFRVIGRKLIVFDSNSEDGGKLEESQPAGDGTYLLPQPLVQHDGTTGKGYMVLNPTSGAEVQVNSTYVVENFPKDIAVAFPGQVTIIRALFDREGQFNWHCHILSHEDHEMMRIYHVGPLTPDQLGGKPPSNTPSPVASGETSPPSPRDTQSPIASGATSAPSSASTPSHVISAATSFPATPETPSPVASLTTSFPTPTCTSPPVANGATAVPTSSGTPPPVNGGPALSPEPTSLPTSFPTSSPTSFPTSTPTSTPTSDPTSTPTSDPTSTPTSKPTAKPPPAAGGSANSPAPSVSFEPSRSPRGSKRSNQNMKMMHNKKKNKRRKKMNGSGK